jgi:hypothetical protein
MSSVNMRFVEGPRSQYGVGSFGMDEGGRGRGSGSEGENRYGVISEGDTERERE